MLPGHISIFFVDPDKLAGAVRARVSFVLCGHSLLSNPESALRGQNNSCLACCLKWNPASDSEAQGLNPEASALHCAQKLDGARTTAGETDACPTRCIKYVYIIT